VWGIFEKLQWEWKDLLHYAKRVKKNQGKK
jgi:hypothetical protein